MLLYRKFWYIVVIPVRPSVQRISCHLSSRLHLESSPNCILGSDWACLVDAQKSSGFFIFAPGVNWEPKNDVYGHVVVTRTLSTFSGEGIWYSRKRLGMSCRYAVRIRNFHFATRGRNDFKLHFYYLAQSCFPTLLLPSFEVGVTLHFNKVESPLHMDTLCQVWLKMAQLVLSRRFWNVINMYSLFGYYLLLEKCMFFYFNKLEFHTLC